MQADKKFRQLIEYFLKKVNAKCGGETSPKTFSKKSKLSITIQILFSDHLFFLRYWVIYLLEILVFQFFYVMSFEINLFHQAIILHDQKSQDETFR